MTLSLGECVHLPRPLLPVPLPTFEHFPNNNEVDDEGVPSDVSTTAVCDAENAVTHVGDDILDVGPIQSINIPVDERLVFELYLAISPLHPMFLMETLAPFSPAAVLAHLPPDMASRSVAPDVVLAPPL